MPRPSKQSALDFRISGLAHQFGSALVQAVREHLSSEVAQLINGRARRNGTSTAGARSSGRRLKRGSVNETVLATLLGVVKASPGLRSEQIYKKVTLPRKLAKAGLAKLREQRKVRIKGVKRAAKYSVA